MGDTECDTCAAAAEVGFGFVGVRAGPACGPCATGMATATTRREVKEVKSVVKCIVAFPGCYYALGAVCVYYRDREGSRASGTLSTGYMYSRIIVRTDAVGWYSWGSKERGLVVVYSTERNDER